MTLRVADGDRAARLPTLGQDEAERSALDGRVRLVPMERRIDALTGRAGGHALRARHADVPVQGELERPLAARADQLPGALAVGRRAHVERLAVPRTVERDGHAGEWLFGVGIADHAGQAAPRLGQRDMRWTSTITRRGLGAVVTNTTWPSYVPGVSVGSPMLMLTGVLPPTGMVPLDGVSDSQLTSR